MQKPTLGRIVLYVLTVQDVEEINKSRAMDARLQRKCRTQLSLGNPHVEGEIVAAVIVRPWGETETAACNLQLMLDGPDLLWVTSRSQSDGPVVGQFHFPEIKQGKPVKLETVALVNDAGTGANLPDQSALITENKAREEKEKAEVRLKLEGLTVAQLKKELTDAKIEFAPDAKKADLIELFFPAKTETEEANQASA